MKKLTYIILALFLFGCNSKTLSSDLEKIEFKQTLDQETVKLRIDNLYSNGNGENKLKIVDSNEIKVEGTVNKELLDNNFSVAYTDNKILIKTDRQDPFENLNLDLTIYGPIDDIEINGGFSLIYENPKIKNLDVKMFGAGDFTFSNLSVENVNIQLEGAAHFKLSGVTDHFNVHLEGAGSIEAFDLISDSANLTIEGTGNVETTVKEHPNATLDGLGNITYNGSPKITQEINGLGTINKK